MVIPSYVIAAALFLSSFLVPPRHDKRTMKVAEVAFKFQTEMNESQNQRDKRVEELWRKLDPQGLGELDLKGLQKGMQRIDHRVCSQFPFTDAKPRLTDSTNPAMKNADEMLREIIRVVDTNGDGKIQYDGASNRSTAESPFSPEGTNLV